MALHVDILLQEPIRPELRRLLPCYHGGAPGDVVAGDLDAGAGLEREHGRSSSRSPPWPIPLRQKSVDEVSLSSALVTGLRVDIHLSHGTNSASESEAPNLRPLEMIALNSRPCSSATPSGITNLFPKTSGR
ncbi:hypothetical protein B296_00038331 [Ensete ventricosum]|uniref:Uncharacterized protein n=1 Tax=Ensete ventricosum TaxID=4639 RepID=A0A426ZWV6_ENSVE|nr:hypothetical protein B296_00038331 [Ensete ventricosum]